MPYKNNEPRRNKINKSQYRIENRDEYNEALRKRGSITLYITEDAIATWKPEPIQGKRGHPQEYSEHAIECCLMIRQVFKLPLRQTEGFMGSVVGMTGLELSIPDYSCISRRSIGLKLQRLIDRIEPGSCCIVDSTGLKVYGKDEWHPKKHNVKARRSWRKLHLAINEKHQIIASALTEKEVGDPTVLPELLDQINDFELFMADGAYDSHKVYEQVLQKQPEANIVIPPPKSAVTDVSEHAMRNQHVDTTNERGRIAWQKETNYGLRALVELAMLRFKTIIGPKLKSRELAQ